MTTSEKTKFVKTKKIEDTPFTLVTNDKDGKKTYFIALGNIRITEETEEKDYLINQLREKNWDFLITTIHAIFELAQDYSNSQKKSN